MSLVQRARGAISRVLSRASALAAPPVDPANDDDVDAAPAVPVLLSDKAREMLAEGELLTRQQAQARAARRARVEEPLRGSLRARLARKGAG